MGPGGPGGFIVFGAKRIGSGYGKEEISYIDTVFRFGSLSPQNSIHYRVSAADLKTSLNSRSLFLLRPEEELIIVRRYSGEVSILMRDADYFRKFNDIRESAMPAAERIRSSIEDMTVHFNRKQLRAAVRFGISRTVIVSGLEPGKLIQQANTALYKAKSEGRNRVSCY